MSLAVVIYTAEGPAARRTKYAVETVQALRHNLISAEPVWWHIADDGSREAHRRAISDAAQAVADDEALHAIAHWTVSNSEGRGYGPNVNAARDALQAQGPPEFVLCVEDDWRLARPFDPLPMMRMMRELPDVGCVRLSYIAYTADLFARFRSAADHQWLELRRDSPEGFIFSGNPRLEHWEFQRDFRWADGLAELNAKHGRGGAPGEYELDAAWRLKIRERRGRSEVVWPCDFIPAAPGTGSLFAHIGTERSW